MYVSILGKKSNFRCSRGSDPVRTANARVSFNGIGPIREKHVDWSRYVYIYIYIYTYII